MSKEPQTCSRSGFKTTCGGQALIEGIMMRGPQKQSVVVRKPDGELEIKTTDLKLIKDKYPILGLPFIRGPVNFVASMVAGVGALMYSAEFYPEDEGAGEPSKFDQWLEKHLGNEKAAKAVISVAVVLGLAFSVCLFFLLPTAIAGLFDRLLGVTHPVVHNLIEGVIRIAIFMLYLMLVSKTSDIRRVFSYHGAEHKTIFCYEAGLPLTVENVRRQPKHHPRCGTSFLFVVIVASILISSVVFSFVDWGNMWVRMGLHLLLLPVVVALTWELNRFVGRHDNALTRALTAPGMWMQNWTTFEPDDSMIEVGIAALKEVLPKEAGQDAW